MDMGLAGKAIIITGAASGIGRAAALKAAAEGADRLVLTDRNAGGLAETSSLLPAGARAELVVADLGTPAAPGAIAGAARQAFGRIDGLVNAAGLTTRAGLAEATPAVWETLFSVNTRAPFFLMQEVVADLRSRQAPGSIVNVLSVNALVGSPSLAVYSATKGALATLTRNAAEAFMAARIRVNGINLGWAETEAEHAMQAITLGQGEDWAARAAATLPLGRLIQPEEAARLAVYLLGAASEPLSGVCIDLEQKVTGRIS
jgi:NAD(P)-dependent dehydrogenase (short-subunit alcohol dehydrogenase family)